MPNNRMFGYDVLEPKGKRKRPPVRIIREDSETKGKKNRIRSTINDTAKNFATVMWAIRRHLDYVSLFDFHARTGDVNLDEQIEVLMEIQSRPTNFDRGGRCSREKFFRLLESRRVLDGDVGQLYLRDGSCQGIESDLIADPEEKYINENSSHEWVDGVEIDFAGYPRRFSLHSRNKGGVATSFEKVVSAQNFHLYGFFERFASDQVRGISPVTASINHFQDVKENIDYALIRSKIQQLFALVFSRAEEADPLNARNSSFPSTDADHSEDCPDTTPRTLDFSGGTTVLDLETNEKVETIESKNPSTEFQAFTKNVLMIALKALDIPYSFFDEAHTNYSGSRGSWLHYERSTLDKRADQIEARRRWTVFQLQRWIIEGLLVLPRGMTIADLRFEWVPRGMPWWKPSEEIVGDLKAIGAGLTNPQKVTKERGTGDVFDNIRETIKVIKFARELGKQELGEPYQLNFDVQFPAPSIDAGA